MKKVMLLFGMLICIFPLFGQGLQIRGRIITDSEKQPLEFANIVLWTTDSTFVSGCSSDGKGFFRLESVSPGMYYLNISSVGYETTTIVLPDLVQNTNLGDIPLQTATVNLDNVEVTASGIVNAKDRLIAYPTKQQLKSSTNGIELLQSMMLPRLFVDPVREKITIGGGDEVQFRINGAKASKEEVKTIQPNDIIRIEYHDNPGLRYGGAAAVLDYITRRYESGGSFYGNLMNSFVTAWGNDHIGARIDHKKSEFTLTYRMNYRDYYDAWRSNQENFNFPDGNKFSRNEKGLPGRNKFTESWLYGSYNYLDPDKHYLNVTAIFYDYKNPKRNFVSELSTVSQEGRQTLDMFDNSTNSNRIPHLDVYYQFTINKKQLIIANVVSTYTNTQNTRLYQEKEKDVFVADYFSGAKASRYSIIGEGIYENSMDIGRLSVGIKHLQAYTDNQYMGDYRTKAKMDESETAVYAEFQKKIKKVTYTVGIRGTRSFVNQRGVDTYQTYSFLPVVRLNYNPSNNLSLKYSFQAARQLPSLAQLSAVEQIIDSFQVRKGNPTLRPNMAYTNNLSFDFRKKNIGVSFFSMYQYADKPSMDVTLFEDNHFIRTYDTYRNFQRINMEGSFSWKLFKEFAQLSLNGGMNRYISNGFQDIRYRYTDWYYGVNLTLIYKKWMLNGSVYRERNRFSGSESVESGEQGHSVQLKYNQGKYAIGLGALNPFANDFKSEFKNVSLLAPYKKVVYINDLSQMFYVMFSWNLTFGRKYANSGVWKKIYNADSNNSILKGDK